MTAQHTHSLLVELLTEELPPKALPRLGATFAATIVDGLKARGLTSPYLKAFVVARINPLRFVKGEPPPLDELLAGMIKRARGMKLDKIKPEDVARSGGGAAAIAED